MNETLSRNPFTILFFPTVRSTVDNIRRDWEKKKKNTLDTAQPPWYRDPGLIPKQLAWLIGHIRAAADYGCSLKSQPTISPIYCLSTSQWHPTRKHECQGKANAAVNLCQLHHHPLTWIQTINIAPTVQTCHILPLSLTWEENPETRRNWPQLPSSLTRTNDHWYWHKQPRSGQICKNRLLGINYIYIYTCMYMYMYIYPKLPTVPRSGCIGYPPGAIDLSADEHRKSHG